MLPTDEVYGGWPRSGEIDLMESKGNENLVCNGELDGHQKVGQTMHWGPDYSNNAFWRTTWSRFGIILTVSFTALLNVPLLIVKITF